MHIIIIISIIINTIIITMIIIVIIIFSLLLRILPPTIDHNCLRSFFEKFGCQLSDVRHLLLTAQQLNLDVCGVWWVELMERNTYT